MIILSVAFLVLSEVMVFLTGERAPFFLISLFSILILIYIPQFRLYRVVGILVSIIIVIGILELNPTAKKGWSRILLNKLVKLSFLSYLIVKVMKSFLFLGSRCSTKILFLELEQIHFVIIQKNQNFHPRLMT